MAMRPPSPDDRRNGFSTYHWPGTVSLPGSADFQRSAKMWLFDLSPACWRYEEALHRHPAELAVLVMEHLKAQILAMVKYRRRVGNLDKENGSGPARQVADICLRECQRAEALQGQVALVEEALREVDRKRSP